MYYENNFDPEERIDWELQKEQQKQKSIARCAFKKPKRHGCTLPHEKLSKKELQELNGEVKIMNMNKPVAYKAFKMWPKDVQEEYLKGLHKKYSVNLKTIAEMMGVSPITLGSYLRKRGSIGIFPHAPGSKNFKAAEWEKFCQNASESDEKPAEATNSVPEESELVSENAPESLENDRSETNGKLTPGEIIEHVKSGLIPYEEAAKMIDKYYPEIAAACNELNQERIEDVKKQIETLTDELKNTKPNPVLEKGCFPDYPYPWDFEEKPVETKLHSDLQFLTFSFRVKDLKSWDELFEFVKAVKLPFNNTVEINVQEYYRPFGPGALPECQERCI